MKSKVNLFLSLVSMTIGLAVEMKAGLAQEPVPPGAETAAPAEATIAGSVCPRYIWMFNGTYYSYYSQKSPSCFPVNYDSTSASLATWTSCLTGGPGCIATRQARGDDGAAVDATDPGIKGYGAGQPVGKGDKRGRLVRLPGSRPWTAQATKLAVSHVDDFEVNFKLPDGTLVQAQVMVIKAKIAGSTDKEELLGRGNEILRFNNPRPPTAGTVGEVTPIAGRPHAFELEYTPKEGGTPVTIEIITHYSTLGHGL